MSEDDVAYTTLLTQLLSDNSSTRNARVHSWIEHQYDFALSEQEQDALAKDGVSTSYPSFATSRSPSPSPSSSLGAHRTFSVDRPDSPLLPRLSGERSSSPRTDPCPSYDALFFPTTSSPESFPEDKELEERERERALRFLVQEMAHWNMQSPPVTPHKFADKVSLFSASSREYQNSPCFHHIRQPLPAPPPPSPASSTTQSTSSRVLRSRSSSTRISRLPSFTSTLSSDQSQPPDIFTPPLPVSLIVHGEPHHDLVLRHEHPLVDAYLHQRNDSFTKQLLRSQEQELHLLSPIQDDKDSLYPSPTLSNFSYAYSRETAVTTPCASFPTSPASATFTSSACSPESIALPPSPEDEREFFGEEFLTKDRDRAVSQSSSHPVFPVSPTGTIFPVSPDFSALPAYPVTSPATSVFPAFTVEPSEVPTQQQHLRAPKSGDHSQSRWSVATTASLTPLTPEPKANSFLSPSTPRSKGKKDKELKTPRKRTRFISLISRFSPGRGEISTATTTSSITTDEYDSANESDPEDARDKGKQKKAMGKKSSLASLRASFSLSRASFSSQRPPLSSPVEELDTSLPPIPQSASTIASFHSSSQVSISHISATSASASRISLLSPNPDYSASRISLIPPPSKRTSLASAAGIEAPVSIHPMPVSETVSRSKSIFRLSTKPKTPKPRSVSGPSGKTTPSKLPVPGNSISSRIPPAPMKFTPPAKLASVLASQSPRIAPAPTNHVYTPLTSKLPAPSRIASPSSKLPRSPPAIKTAIDTKPSADDLPSTPLTSKLPLPASVKGPRVGTVRGFWRRP
ncbi:hypothetical protein BU15DRAFT_74674 [Melanogaster broomeanus]|nr:hypothetical protein BU15DRAFT_74674 [Melanogaster broomeanus]